MKRDDHDILDYHYDYAVAHPEMRFDDPHLHAPLSEISDHDPIIDEHRPADEDFYSFKQTRGLSVMEYEGQEEQVKELHLAEK